MSHKTLTSRFSFSNQLEIVQRLATIIFDCFYLAGQRGRIFILLYFSPILRYDMTFKKQLFFKLSDVAGILIDMFIFGCRNWLKAAIVGRWESWSTRWSSSHTTTLYRLSFSVSESVTAKKNHPAAIQPDNRPRQSDPLPTGMAARCWSQVKKRRRRFRLLHWPVYTADILSLSHTHIYDRLVDSDSCHFPHLIPVGSNHGSRLNSGRGSPESRSGSTASSRRGTMSSELGADQEVGLDALMKRMKSLAEHRQEFSAEEQTKRYEHVESQSAELGVVSSAGDVTRPKPEISQFIDDPDFTYQVPYILTLLNGFWTWTLESLGLVQDFARRGSVNLIPTFRVQDYSWDDHAFSLINRLYNDVGNLLDDKFRLMYQLTYNFMGSKKDVDTSRFRTAIWNYIQCMFGIRHDDYDYGEVNQVLERSLKAYIKTAVCFPERVTRADYDSILKEFHHSEKVKKRLFQFLLYRPILNLGFLLSDSRQFDAVRSSHPSRTALRSACRHALHDIKKKAHNTSSFHTPTVRDFFPLLPKNSPIAKKEAFFFPFTIGLFSTP